MYYNSHRKLNVWKEAITLAKVVYKLQQSFPKSEMYGLCDQLRRAVVSISANIAEGNARQYDKDRARFFNIALSNLAEVDSLLAVAVELDYLQKTPEGAILNPAEGEPVLGIEEQCELISKMLCGLIRA